MYNQDATQLARDWKEAVGKLISPGAGPACSRAGARLRLGMNRATLRFRQLPCATATSSHMRRKRFAPPPNRHLGHELPKHGRRARRLPNRFGLSYLRLTNGNCLIDKPACQPLKEKKLC